MNFTTFIRQPNDEWQTGDQLMELGEDDPVSGVFKIDPAINAVTVEFTDGSEVRYVRSREVGEPT